MNDQKGTTENSFKAGDKVRVLPHPSGWIVAGKEGVVERVAGEGKSYFVYVVFDGFMICFRPDELELIVPEPDPKIALLEGILSTLERIEAGGRHLVGPVEESPGDAQNLSEEIGEREHTFEDTLAEIGRVSAANNEGEVFDAEAAEYAHIKLRATQRTSLKQKEEGAYSYEKTNVYINKRRAYLRTGFYQKEA